MSPIQRVSIIGFFLLAVYLQAPAQSVLSKQITWHSTKVLDERSGQSKEVNSEFITTEDELIWNQQNRHPYKFKIVGKNGTWEDVGTDGTLRLTLQIGTRQCTVDLSKSNGMTKLLMSMPESDDKIVIYEFLIDRIVIQ